MMTKSGKTNKNVYTLDSRIIPETIRIFHTFNPFELLNTVQINGVLVGSYPNNSKRKNNNKKNSFSVINMIRHKQAFPFGESITTLCKLLEIYSRVATK